MIHKTRFKAMGCQMLAAIEYPSRRAAQWLGQVPDWFETWEASLSRFRPESELNLLNQRPGETVRVSNTMWHVLQAAINAEEQSDGLVTPAVLDALVSAGYSQSFDHLEQDQFMAPADSFRLPPLRSIGLRPEDHSICLPAGLHLDFGGVAKGWAAQQAMKRLKSRGPALVDAGGDIAISGLQADGQPWLVGIEDPLHPGQYLETLRLGRCGIATSGRDYRRWKQNGTWQHHIIDPRSGKPAQTDVLTATVIAPTVLEAEMAAKVVLIRGSKEGLHWLDMHPSFAGIVVTENGQTWKSRSFGIPSSISVGKQVNI
jgi:FAD:protein FMN transferase